MSLQPLFLAPFFAAPHRVMFMAGTVQALLAMVLWGTELGGRLPGLWPAPAWPLPPPWWHALLLLYGVFPFFVFGFILTAGPRWQGAAETPARVFLPSFFCLAGGWLVVLLSIFAAALLPVGLLAVMAGWLIAIRWLWRVAARPVRDRLHIRLVVAALLLGLAGIGAFAAAAAGADPRWARLGIALGLWGCLLPLFLTVAHRMLPFFTGAAIRGYVAYRADWTLIALCLAALGHGLLSWLEAGHWLWLPDLAGAGLAIHLTLRWNLRASLAERMVAVLHIAFAWIGLAFAMSAIDSLLALVGRTVFGLAPLHALTLGFFASMLIGMASRVTLGHSGQPVRADRAVWGAFWVLQAAAVLRILAELPAAPAGLSLAAALLWLGAFAAWALRFGPLLWRPRADGKPG